MLFQIAEILPREMGGVLACCNPIPILLRQQQHEVFMLVQQARDSPLTDKVMRESLKKLGGPNSSARYLWWNVCTNWNKQRMGDQKLGGGKLEPQQTKSYVSSFTFPSNNLLVVPVLFPYFLGTVLFPWYLLCRANYNSKQLDCQTVRQAQSFKLTNIFVGGHSITTIRADYFCLCYFCQTRKKRNDRTHTTNNGWDICRVAGYYNLPCMWILLHIFLINET